MNQGDEVVTECTAVRDDLLDVLYGEADSSARARFAAHARDCASRPALAVAAAVLVALAGAFTVSGQARPDEAYERRLAALEARQREEVAALRAELARVRLETEEAAVRRASRLVEDSEARQAVLVGASMASLREEADAARRYDLAQVGAGLSYIEGKTGLQAARTTELMGHVLLAAQKR
jgi:hypothetical protein